MRKCDRTILRPAESALAPIGCHGSREQDVFVVQVMTGVLRGGTKG